MSDDTPDVQDARARQLAREALYRRFSRRGMRRQRLRRLVRGITWVFIVKLFSAFKRVLDFVLALGLILIFSPALLAVSMMLFWNGPVLRRTPRSGRWCVAFDEYAFAERHRAIGRLPGRLGVNRLPVLFNILKGEMSFVGPRLVSPGDLSPRQRAVRRRYDVRPGLICLWWIRRRANIDYGSEAESDSEYVETQSVWGDLGIALRAIPAVLYGEGVATAPDEIEILGIPIHNLTMDEAVDEILRRLDADTPSQVCFVNADCANLSYKDPDYLDVLHRADVNLADGIGMKMAGKLLARDIRQNVNGTDLFPRLCEALSHTGHGLFLLGARPGVTEAVRDWVAAHHPGVKVSGFQHGYFDPEAEGQVIQEIRTSGALLLLVAFGAPRQDLWVRRHLGETGVRVAMGVGGLFDFYAGRISRAPLWMREMGLEWFYRFYQEPGRMWKRYFWGNAVFLFRVMAEKMGWGERTVHCEGGNVR